MRVSLVEYGVFNYPKGLEEWRCFRIEYGGHAENCITEGHIWLPPDTPPEVIERILSYNHEIRIVEYRHPK